jgi:hypothetical protein
MRCHGAHANARQAHHERCRSGPCIPPPLSARRKQEKTSQGERTHQARNP